MLPAGFFPSGVNLDLERQGPRDTRSLHRHRTILLPIRFFDWTASLGLFDAAVSAAHRRRKMLAACWPEHLLQKLAHGGSAIPLLVLVVGWRGRHRQAVSQTAPSSFEKLSLGFRSYLLGGYSQTGRGKRLEQLLHGWPWLHYSTTLGQTGQRNMFKLAW